MSNQHTPEPWSSGFYTAAEFPFNICAPDGRVLATVKGEQDRRRIVACVNACAGIPIGELELSRRGSGLRDVAVVHQATTQRDELLAALREIRLLASYERGTEDANIHEIARAAIAKVEP